MNEMKLTIKPEAFRLLGEIKKTLGETPAYIVGGFLRDTLLGRDTDDIDIAVEDAAKSASVISRALGGKCFPLDEVNGIYRVVLPERRWHLDFSSIEGDIENDLARRDFTINATAIDLQRLDSNDTDAKKIIDPFGGIKDIERHLVKAVNDSVFVEDAARLLRAVRIAAELGFDIAGDTEQMIRRDGLLISGTAGERVREELLRILAIPGAGQRLAYLDELGLLTALIPELNAARGVDQPRIHYWDVFDHSIETVTALEYLLREGNWEHTGEEVRAAVPWPDKLAEHFDRPISSGSTGRSLLKLAALLHDIAKPETRTIDEDGRARFLGHQTEGATTAVNILERLRFTNREIQLVELLIKYHLRPTQMRQEGLPTRRAIYRFFRDTGEAGIDLLFLCLADHLATRGPELDFAQWQEHARATEHVLARHEEMESQPTLTKLINGHDLIKWFGMEPGPMVGEILEAVNEARAAGEIDNREQARKYAEKMVQQQPKSSIDKTARGER